MSNSVLIQKLEELLHKSFGKFTKIVINDQNIDVKPLQKDKPSIRKAIYNSDSDSLVFEFELYDDEDASIIIDNQTVWFNEKSLITKISLTHFSKIVASKLTSELSKTINSNSYSTDIWQSSVMKNLETRKASFLHDVVKHKKEFVNFA